MSHLTIDDLKRPPERVRVTRTLPSGKTVTLRRMFEGERLDWEDRNIGKKDRTKNLRGLLIAATLENGDGELMLSEDDVLSEWWRGVDSVDVAAMFKSSMKLNGFDDDDFDGEEEAKNSPNGQA